MGSLLPLLLVLVLSVLARCLKAVSLTLVMLALFILSLGGVLACYGVHSY